MGSRYRWREQLLGSLQGQLQLASYLVVFLGFTGASSVGLLIGQRNLLAYELTRTTIIELQHCHEGLLRHIHLAHRLHALLALGLLLQQFLLP